MSPHAGKRNKKRGKNKGQANQQAPAVQVAAPQVPPPQEEDKGQEDGDTCPQGLPVLQGLSIKDGSHQELKDPEPSVAQPSGQDSIQPVGSPKATEEVNNGIALEEDIDGDSDASTALFIEDVPIGFLSDGKGDQVQLKSPRELIAYRNNLDKQLENAIAAQEKYEAEALKLLGKPLAEADPEHYKQVCDAVEKLRAKRNGAEKALQILNAAQTDLTRKGRDIWQAKKELAHFQEELKLFKDCASHPFQKEFEKTEEERIQKHKSLMEKKISANEMCLGLRITFPSQDGMRFQINQLLEATPNLTACVELGVAEDGKGYDVLRVFPVDMMKGVKGIVAGYNAHPDFTYLLLRLRNLGKEYLKKMQKQK